MNEKLLIAELESDLTENEQIREKMARILSAIAIELKGPEPELTMWGWHDLVQLVKADKARIAGLESALKVIHTWAACDVDSTQTRCMVMKDIENMAMKALRGEERAHEAEKL